MGSSWTHLASIQSRIRDLNKTKVAENCVLSPNAKSETNKKKKKLYFEIAEKKRMKYSRYKI